MSDGNGSLTKESVAEVLESRERDMRLLRAYRSAVTMDLEAHSVLLSRNRQGRHQQSLAFNHVGQVDSVLARAFECTKG